MLRCLLFNLPLISSEYLYTIERPRAQIGDYKMEEERLGVTDKAVCLGICTPEK